MQVGGFSNTEFCGFCPWANFLARNHFGARCREAVLLVSVPPVVFVARGWRAPPDCFLSLGCPECGLGPQCCAESPADQSAPPGPVPAHPPGASPAPAPPPAANLQDIPTYPAKYNVKDFGARGDGNTGGSRLGDHRRMPVRAHALALCLPGGAGRDYRPLRLLLGSTCTQRLASVAAVGSSGLFTDCCLFRPVLADDTAAFLSAVAQASAEAKRTGQGVAVLAPNGRYRITQKIVIGQSNVVLRGEGVSPPVLAW